MHKTKVAYPHTHRTQDRKHKHPSLLLTSIVLWVKCQIASCYPRTPSRSQLPDSYLCTPWYRSPRSSRGRELNYSSNCHSLLPLTFRSLCSSEPHESCTQWRGHNFCFMGGGPENTTVSYTWALSASSGLVECSARFLMLSMKETWSAGCQSSE